MQRSDQHTVARQKNNRLVCERPGPKGIPPSARLPSYFHAGDSNSCPPDQELGALTKILASRLRLIGMGRIVYENLTI